MAVVRDAAFDKLFHAQAAENRVPPMERFQSINTSDGSADLNTYGFTGDQSGGWEALEHQMEEIQHLMQLVNFKVNCFQCQMRLVKQSSIGSEKQEHPTQSEPPLPSTITATQELIHVTDHPLQQPESQPPRASDCASEEPFSLSTSVTVHTNQQDETQTNQDSQPLAPEGDELMETDNKHSPVQEEPTPPESATAMNLSRSSAHLVSLSPIRVLPVDSSVEFNRRTRAPMDDFEAINTPQSDLPAKPSTKHALLLSCWEFVKGRCVPTRRSASVYETVASAKTWPASAPRLSLLHGLQHSGTENFIRHVPLERLLLESNEEPSFSRRLRTSLDLLILGNADNKPHRFSIHHESTTRLLWDSMVMLFMLADVIATPLAVSFEVEGSTMQLVDISSLVVYMFDMVVRCLTTYSADKGAVLISEPVKTAGHYLSSRWLPLDLISCFPWESIFQRSSLGRLIGLAKCVRLGQLPQMTRRVVPFGFLGILGIVQLLATVFLISHFNACFWNAIALDWRHHTTGYDQHSVFWRYVLCWSTSIGAINASPPSMHNPIEEITIALYMIMGNVLQATVFGSVAHVISSFNEEEDTYRRKLMQTQDRCRFLGIPHSLSSRIQSYYKSLYRETKTVSTDADAFINELSPALLCDVKYSLFRDMLKQIPFLASKRIDNSVVELLLSHLTTVIFMKDDIVTRRGEPADWMGFIGVKGSVARLEYVNQCHYVGRILSKGDYFGEKSVFHAAKREHTMVALGWVQIHQLFRTDFESVKETQPDQGKILEEEMVKYMRAAGVDELGLQ